MISIVPQSSDQKGDGKVFLEKRILILLFPRSTWTLQLRLFPSTGCRRWPSDYRSSHAGARAMFTTFRKASQSSSPKRCYYPTFTVQRQEAPSLRLQRVHSKCHLGPCSSRHPQSRSRSLWEE